MPKKGKKDKTDTPKCQRCGSACCHYITVRVPTPTSIEDFDGLYWQICHKNIHIFKDCEGWYILVVAACTNLKRNGMCAIYDERPNICRDHTAAECEMDSSIEESAPLYFKDAQSFDEYCGGRFKSWKRRFRKD